ncbi:MAG: HdeD family acid-resistance protein [Thiotrichales bacterium]
MNDVTEFDQKLNDLLEELPLNWKVMLAIGVFMVFAGTFGIGLSAYLTLGSMFVFAALIGTAGVLQFIQGVQAKEKKWIGRSQHFGIAILYILTAGIMVWDPVAASAGVTLFLAALFAAMGAMKIWYAVRCKRHDWKWVLPSLSGLISLILSGLILITWPASSLWLLGLLIAIELLANGWFLTLLAMRVKKAGEDDAESFDGQKAESQ